METQARGNETAKGYPSEDQPMLSFSHGLSPETSLKIHLMGATIISWKVDGEEMLYLSSKTSWDGRHSLAIRGGVSLFFPHIGTWMFGPTNGFAKTSKEWKVYRAPQTDQKTGDVKVVLVLEDTPISRKMWSRKFLLLYTIILTKNSVIFRTDVTNKGDMTISVGLTIRPHLLVPDVTKCKLGNVKGLFFTDKAEDGWPEALQRQDLVTVNNYVDRVYANAPNTCVLAGLAKGKQLRIAKSGFQDISCWNPWNRFKLPDMGCDDYRKMFCVDAAQCSKKAVLKRGETWSGTYSLTVS